jgi:hypothetical protein
MGQVSELQRAVEAEALRRGANKAAVLKWRRRGVPPGWKLRLIEEGCFTVAELAQLPAAAEHCPAPAEAAE